VASAAACCTALQTHPLWARAGGEGGGGGYVDCSKTIGVKGLGLHGDAGPAMIAAVIRSDAKSCSAAQR
jgi:hypothetical protein